MFTGKAATLLLEACSIADYGNSFNPDGKDRTLDHELLVARKALPPAAGL
jgi:hypothetical protein